MKTILSLLILLLIVKTSLSQEKSDTSRFEKIIVNTTRCFGYCPVYDIEIKRNRQVRLNIKLTYKKIDKRQFIIDSSKIGFYTGKINKYLLNKINRQIILSNLKTLEADTILCCDGSVRTIISYFGNKKYYYQTMFPNENVSNLLELIFRVAKQSNLTKTTPSF